MLPQLLKLSLRSFFFFLWLYSFKSTIRRLVEYCYHTLGGVRNNQLDMLDTAPKHLRTDIRLRSPECFMITAYIN